MDLIFFEHPQLLLFLAGGVVLHILSLIFREKSFSPVIALINIALHSAGVCAMYIAGGDNQDILLYLLISAFLALIQCKKPADGKEDGDK